MFPKNFKINLPYPAHEVKECKNFIDSHFCQPIKLDFQNFKI